MVRRPDVVRIDPRREHVWRHRLDELDELDEWFQDMVESFEALFAEMRRRRF
jgi:hypothetical protein